MGASPTPPQPGQHLWGNDLNAYLLSLEARIAANEERFDTQTAQLIGFDTRLTALEGELDLLTERIIVLEARPEHIYNSFPWQYSNQAPPATGNQVRFNTSDPTQATQIDIRREDSDGADRANVFMNLSPGSNVRINDWDDAAITHRFEVTGPTMIGATNAQIPVTWDGGNGILPNAKVNVAFLVVLLV